MRRTLKECMSAGDFSGAMQIIDDRMGADPADDESLFYFTSLMISSEHPGPARIVCHHLADRYPEKWQAWLNLGLAQDGVGLHDEAVISFDRALTCEGVDVGSVHSSITAAAINAEQWDRALASADVALDIEPNNIQAATNKGYALLHARQYGEGWDHYMTGIGHQQWRERREYGNRPHWRGEEEARVVLYGEQGIGDQVAFMSALPDALDLGAQIVGVSCYPKMTHLFRDTLEPYGIRVEGTQFVEQPEWLADVDYTHIAPMSQLQQLYRREESVYSGRPYLRPNAAKVLQWSALLQSVSSRPKVGIAWSGGRRRSDGWRRKSMGLADMLPILETPGVDFVSLQYKDASDEIAALDAEHGITVREWPWGTQTEDYSDTAALVACLDMVVSVPTSVCHLAGALAVPTHVLVHERPHFHYSMGMPYYRSVELHGRDEDAVAAVADEVAKLAGPKIVLVGHGDD